MAWSTNPHLTPRLKIRTIRQIPFYACMPYYRATFTFFTLYFPPNIIRSDQVKDDMCYTEREEEEKML